MSVRNETNFCCSCLNTEVKFRKIDKKTANNLKEFLSSQVLEDSLYRNICMVCYTLLMKSIKFKEQCLEVKHVYFNMVHVSQESLNLYKFNYKPNLRQTQVTFLNLDVFPSLSANTDPVMPTIEEVNVDVKEEIIGNECILDEDFKTNRKQTQVKFLNVDVLPSVSKSTYHVIPTIEELKVDIKEEVVGNESVLGEDFKPNLIQTEVTFLKEEIIEKEFVVDEKFYFVQENGLKLKDNLLRDLNVVENDKVVIEMDKHPETLMCRTDKELDEKIYIKEECSDSNQEENLDTAGVDSDASSDDDTPLNKILKTEDTGEILEKTDIDAPARKRTLNEVPQKAKRIKLDGTTNTLLRSLPKNNCKASDTNISKVTKTSPKINIEIQARNEIVQNNKTFDSKFSYNNATMEILNQNLPKRVDAFAPSTSFNRNNEGNKANICNRKRSKKDFSCHICHINFFTKTNLSVHLRVHTGEKLYICDICNYRYTRKETLRQHIKFKHTKEMNFACHICQYKCFAKNALDMHLRKHTGEKPYICGLCNVRCARKGDLTTHVKRKHTEEKNFSCHICQYKCIAKSALDIHLRKHTGEKPYVCDLCDVRCGRKSDLLRHIKRKHTKEMNFACHICQYKCITKSVLNIHLRVHTGEKPYICDVCNVRCARKGDLTTHIKLKHTKEIGFPCHICEYKCVTKSSLDMHLRKHTGEKPYKCDLCHVRCARKGDFLRHIKRKHALE